MKKLFIGFDTSCYTTSVAAVNDEGIILDERVVLSVAEGERGLRQSEALFQHTKNLPVLLERVRETVKGCEIAGVGVSEKPVGKEDSYMPVFLSGMLAARAFSCPLGIPVLGTTHQKGHVRAALHNGNEDLLKKDRFLAFHISGGTTDLLLVRTENGRIKEIESLGCGTDLHAGQFVDRIGVALGLPFPSGKALEKLAEQAQRRDIRIASSVKNGNCSFSGAETALQRRIGEEKDAEIAYAVYDCLARTFMKMTQNAVKEYGNLDVLFSGGVSSSLLLRNLLKTKLAGTAGIRFGDPVLSSDNAVGVALIVRDQNAGC